jgi:uncharacterized protein (TIGR03067 family)
MLAGLLLVVPVLGSDVPREYDGTTESVGLEGTWRLIEITYGGVKHGAPLYVVTFRGGRYTVSDGGKTLEGTYRIDASRRPARLDQIASDGPGRGGVEKYIFQVDGDTLRLAFTYSEEGVDRPEQFTDRHTGIHTFKRVK